jgi:tetratricopeptide (TPR) repeat protein
MCQPGGTISLLLAALRLQRDVLGSTHPATFAAWVALGVERRTRSHLTESLDCLSEAAKFEEVPVWARMQALLERARTYTALNEHEAALLDYEAAASGFSSCLGPSHRDSIFALCGVARCVARLNQNVNAEPLFRRVIAAMTVVEGRAATITLTALHGLASCLMKQSQTTEAISVYEEVLELVSARPDEASRRWALQLRRELAMTQYKCGAWRVALEHLERVVEAKELLGDEQVTGIMKLVEGLRWRLDQSRSCF